MIYLENPLDYEQLEEAFAWERTFSEESQARRKRNPTLRAAGRFPNMLLNKFLKRNKLLQLTKEYVQPGPILDVGCAGGHTIRGFPSEYVPYGIEISHELSQTASNNFSTRGGAVIQANALQGLNLMPAEKFTGVLMTSFLEHEVNPKQTLRAARRVLRPNGRVIIKVPNYNSWHRSIRGRIVVWFPIPRPRKLLHSHHDETANNRLWFSGGPLQRGR